MTVAYYGILTARNSREKPHFTHLPPCVVSLLIYFPLSFSFTDSHPLTSHFTFSLSFIPLYISFSSAPSLPQSSIHLSTLYFLYLLYEYTRTFFSTSFLCPLTSCPIPSSFQQVIVFVFPPSF